jgi:hypothetical protein
MMPYGNWTVLDCLACGDLHPVFFDGYAGIDGDDVCDCPVAGRIELSDLDKIKLREVVSVQTDCLGERS